MMRDWHVSKYSNGICVTAAAQISTFFVRDYFCNLNRLNFEHFFARNELF